MRLQDFKSVSEYNSTLFELSSQSKLCRENITDEDMLEKTFTTFQASNVLLQQQYREHQFTKYSELIACLLVAEKNNELLLQNHQSHPTGSKAFPEANATFASPHSNRQGHKNGPTMGGGGRGRGRGNNSRHHNTGPFQNKKGNSNQGKMPNPQATAGQSITQRQQDNTYYRCGMTCHWSRTCRTTKHLVNLYQASIKDKGKNIEVNFLDDDGDGGVDLTHFDVSDFFEDPTGNISHLIGDGHVNSDKFFYLFSYASTILTPRVKITGDICLEDCATTHSILQQKKYFSQLTLAPSNVTTIFGPVNLIEGSGRATIILPSGTILHLQAALYSTQSKCNLLSFKDIHWNGYHLETMNDETTEFLLITATHDGKKCILEKLRSLECGLYLTTISTVESYAILNPKFSNSTPIVLWHERLGHPCTSMLRRVLHQSNGHSLTTGHISSHTDYNCLTCTQGKFITQPFSLNF